MFGLHIDKSLSVSIAQQLITQIRYQVLQGKLKGGEKLPPSRNLAKELNVARNIIIQVYDQLIAEGYLESRVGSGTFIIDLKSFHLNQPAGQNKTIRHEEPMTYIRDNVIDFHSGNPDVSHFPRIQWAKILKETCLEAPSDTFGYGPVAGEPPLRSAISRYLFRTKGIDCHPDHIFIVPGATLGVDLLCKVFHKDIDNVVIEDPCISFVQHTFMQNGFSIHPVPVDHQGIKTFELPENHKIKLIYVVPSHQFPIGSILPIGRRLQLLDYARDRNAYIIEDDYDSEFRYEGGPIMSLHHLDPERVIYLGTFSKIFSPSLRLGYIILPSNLIKRVYTFMELINIRTPSLEQLAMARFIDTKLIDRHVYKMKKVYQKKRKHLINSLYLAFGDKVRVAGENAGLHVLTAFKDLEFHPSDFQKFLENGVEVDWVEDYAIRKGLHINQLVLGYGNISLEQITVGVQRIKEVINGKFLQK
ncbi:MAG: PLP-dependent aminotransferase family protein [Bacillota bacterium]